MSTPHSGGNSSCEVPWLHPFQGYDTAPDMTRSSAIARGPRRSTSLEILSTAATQLYKNFILYGLQQVHELEGNSRSTKLQAACALRFTCLILAT